MKRFSHLSFRWSLAALTLVLMLALPWVALADQVVNNIDTTIDPALETKTITAGGSGTVGFYIQPSNEIPPGDASGCNSTGANPATVTLSVPAGVTASPSSLTFTGCGIVQNVTFSSSTAGSYTISVASVTGGKPGSLWYTAPADFTLVVNPPSDTTPPATTITLGPATPNGLNGWYVSNVHVTVSAVDNPGGSGVAETRCVLDPASAPGSFDDIPAGCAYTGAGADVTTEGQHIVYAASKDNAGNKETPVSKSFKIDKTAPQLSSCDTPDGVWHANNVTLYCTYTDGGSGPASQQVSLSTSVAAGDETANAVASAGGAQACDAAGNCAASPADIAGNKVDRKAPSITWNGSINDGDSFYYGDVPAAPTCTATDSGSGPKRCDVSGYSAEVGTHTLTATAYDNVNNEAKETRSYTVLPWTLYGFYQPVDMGDTMWNTVKGGSTVPLKFEVFKDLTELTDPSVVKSFVAAPVLCPKTGYVADEIEFVTTGGTVLRYDWTAGQFIQNWQTPKKPGACYQVTMTTKDGSKLVAKFALK